MPCDDLLVTFVVTKASYVGTRSRVPFPLCRSASGYVARSLVRPVTDVVTGLGAVPAWALIGQRRSVPCPSSPCCWRRDMPVYFDPARGHLVLRDRPSARSRRQAEADASTRLPHRATRIACRGAGTASVLQGRLSRGWHRGSGAGSVAERAGAGRCADDARELSQRPQRLRGAVPGRGRSTTSTSGPSTTCIGTCWLVPAVGAVRCRPRRFGTCTGR